MTTISEEVLNKIAALKAKADSAKSIGELQEAEAFASAVQSLLLKYKLDMSEIEFKKELDEPVERTWTHFEEHDIRFRPKRVAWIERLAQIICDAYQCRFLVISRNFNIAIIGRKRDAEMVEFMMVTMIRLVDYVCEKEYRSFMSKLKSNGYTKEDGIGYRDSFRMAFNERMMERFKEDREQVKAQSNSTALVRIDQSLVKVNEFIRNMRCSTASNIGNSRSGFNSHGYKRGREVADGVSLKPNAIKQGESSKSKQIER